MKNWIAILLSGFLLSGCARNESYPVVDFIHEHDENVMVIVLLKSGAFEHILCAFTPGTELIYMNEVWVGKIRSNFFAQQKHYECQARHNSKLLKQQRNNFWSNKE